jgi:hypothetical protein
MSLATGRGRNTRSRPGSVGGKRSGALGGLASRAIGAVGKKKKAKHHRGRGITARELRGFRKVTNLLRKVGMHPRGLGRSYRRKR